MGYVGNSGIIRLLFVEHANRQGRNEDDQQSIDERAKYQHWAFPMSGWGTIEMCRDEHGNVSDTLSVVHVNFDRWRDSFGTDPYAGWMDFVRWEGLQANPVRLLYAIDVRNVP